METMEQEEEKSKHGYGFLLTNGRGRDIIGDKGARRRGGVCFRMTNHPCREGFGCHLFSDAVGRELGRAGQELWHL